MVNVPSITFHHCPECGLRLPNPSTTGGLCPRCLIATAVEDLSTVDHPALGRFGDIGVTPDVAHLNRQLPAYEFIELLGRGGSGWVFRARQRTLNRTVAIKILHGATAAPSDAAHRFTREAQILARLNHRRIVTIHDFGSLPEFEYIVMEYVPGPTLREFLRGHPLGMKAFDIADQICDAVEHAHSIGVLHRDLKPENVLFESFDNSDSVKVADFGISRLIGDTEPGFHQTNTGFVVGTPFYAAPEQMTAGAKIDTRADIYSIGVMLYEMLTGQLPRGRFAPPSQHRRVPAGTDAVVLRCLESDPARRYANLALVRARLRDVASGAAHRRRILKLAAVPAIALVLIAGAWMFLSNRSAHEVALHSATTPDSHSLPQTVATSTSNTVRPQPSKAIQPPAALPKNPPNQPPVVEKPPTAPSSGSLPESHEATASGSPAGRKTDEPFRPLPPPVKQQQGPPPAASLRDEELFQISSVKVYGFTPTSLDFRITGRRMAGNFTVANGNSLVWVVQTAGPHRIDSPFKLDPRSHTFSITDHIALDFGDAWPLQIFIAERWYSPNPGARRLSNITVVNASDIRAEPPPKP